MLKTRKSLAETKQSEKPQFHASGSRRSVNFWIHALAASLTLIERYGVEKISAHVLDLGDHLIRRVDAQGIRLVGPRARAHRSHIYVLDLPGTGWPEYLAAENVRVSPERDGIRVSFGFFNTTDDIDRLMEIIRRRTNSDAPRAAAELMD